MTFTELSNKIFNESVLDYHKTDYIDEPIKNPYELKTIEYYLYLKNWIDTVQWHLEDIIRDPNIDPVAALSLKRRIDHSNQDRTDLVELIDSYFWDKYNAVALLRESEEKYRLLYNAMEQGLALHEIITDKNKKPLERQNIYNMFFRQEQCSMNILIPNQAKVCRRCSSYH